MFSDLKHIYFCKDIEYYFKNQILFDFFNLDKKIFSFLTEVMKPAISKYGDSNMNNHRIIKGGLAHVSPPLFINQP